MVESVVITSAARTAIGAFGGSLADTSAVELGTITAKEAISRSGMDAEAIGHTVLGNVIHGETRDMYISRVVSVEAGVSK
ncbi:MAG: acetyl-CoA C-acyltransferase, partial [Alphaproteobacteria bacterium]